jgi:hypothetical protein
VKLQPCARRCGQEQHRRWWRFVDQTNLILGVDDEFVDATYLLGNRSTNVALVGLQIRSASFAIEQHGLNAEMQRGPAVKKTVLDASHRVSLLFS